MTALWTRIKSIYHTVENHLIKTMGALGAVVLAVDPETIGGAASSYLGSSAQRKIGVGLFALVTARAWYAGREVAKLKAQLAQKPPGA